MTSSLWRSTTVRLAAGGLVAAALSGSLAGCSLDDLSPIELEMSATLDRIGFVVGEPLNGTVEDAHGSVKVSLVPARLSAVADDADQDPAKLVDLGGAMNSTAAVSCDVADDASYSCPTVVEGKPLELGRYVVEVRDLDADYESPDAVVPADREGVAVVQIPVVLAESADYQPWMGSVLPEEMDTGRTHPREAYSIGVVGEPTVVKVGGWSPNTSLKVYVLDETGGPLSVLSAKVDAAGAGRVTIPAVDAPVERQLIVTDGVWAGLQYFSADPK